MSKDSKGQGKPRPPGREGKQQPGGTKRKTQATAGTEQQSAGHRRDRIRLLQHLLKKDDLTAPARAGIERELGRLQQEQQVDAAKERERKLAVRYHKVRFFERKKIDRHIHHLQQAISRQPGGKATAEQEAELEEWNQKLVYVRHYPPGHKYIALLKNADTPEAQAALEAKRQEMHALVAARLAAERQAELDKAAINEADEGGADTARAVAAAAAAAAAKAAAAGPAAAPAAAAAAPAPKRKAAPAAAAAPAAPSSAPATTKPSKPAAHPSKPSVPASAAPEQESEDDFFLSDDDEHEDSPQPAAKPAQGQHRARDSAGAGGIERPAAKSWARPVGLDDDASDDSEQGSDGGGDGDSGGFKTSLEKSKGGKGGDKGGKRSRDAPMQQQGGDTAAGGELQGAGYSGMSDKQRKRRRRGGDKPGGDAPGRAPVQVAAAPVQSSKQEAAVEGQGEQKRKRRRRRKDAGKGDS